MPTEPLRKLFGRNVTKRRKALALTQGRLASQTGLTGKYISEIERGVANTSLSVVEKLAAGLGTSPAVLLDADDDLARQAMGTLHGKSLSQKKRALVVMRSLFNALDNE